VCEKIEITLPIASLNVLQSVPLFWKRPQGFGQKPERAHLERRLATFGQETCSFDANEIANVKQTKKIDQIRANFFRVNINLNAASGIAKIKKVALAHVAMRGDAASRTNGLALRKFFAHLRD